ncbi:hypothetical protein J6590_056130 [Homalodisca vitripennis]|nr:hypothetical protein J6590_056130 [Homalodisca vitripennis]
MTQRISNNHAILSIRKGIARSVHNNSIAERFISRAEKNDWFLLNGREQSAVQVKVTVTPTLGKAHAGLI